MRLFKPLQGGRQKDRVVKLLELASVEDLRHKVVQALQWLRQRRQDVPYKVSEMISKCAGFVPGVDWLQSSWKSGAGPVLDSERDWLRTLEIAQNTKPYQFTPVRTAAVTPDRHPWDGYTGTMEFTEISAGIGMFAAAFEAAGMKCVHLVEPNVRALALAVRNCSIESAAPSGLSDVDPGDLQWSHGLVGGPECQPYSSAGKQRAWEDPRSYTLLRALHTMAVMKPWWVWLENVAAIETVKEGAVWGVVQEISELAGYEVRLTQI